MIRTQHDIKAHDVGLSFFSGIFSFPVGLNPIPTDLAASAKLQPDYTNLHAPFKIPSGTRNLSESLYKIHGISLEAVLV